MPVGGRRLYAQSRYHPTPVNSNVRNLTVVAVVTPTIDSVKDTKNIEIPQNGTTTDTTVTLAGKATGNLQVEIFDETTSKGTAQVNANGDWTKQVMGLTVAAHRFTAKALYGTGPVSAVRTVVVIIPFNLDTSPVTLNGICISVPGSLPSQWTYRAPEPSGTYKDRLPTSGVPPYTYTSANLGVASVDANGRVRSEGNGTARITVEDALKRTRSFEVVVSNVRPLIFYPSHHSAFESQQWRISQGGTVLNEADVSLINARFHTPEFYFTGEEPGPYGTMVWVSICLQETIGSGLVLYRSIQMLRTNRYATLCSK